jgi:hypothetical protein
VIGVGVLNQRETASSGACTHLSFTGGAAERERR